MTIKDSLFPLDIWFARLIDPHRRSEDKRRVEKYSRWTVFRETGQLQREERVFDRDKNRYIKRIYDFDGKLIMEVDEPLDQHRDRGSARKRES